MTITDIAMNRLSVALGTSENIDVNTLMLNAAVRINRLTEELKKERRNQNEKAHSSLD